MVQQVVAALDSQAAGSANPVQDALGYIDAITAEEHQHARELIAAEAASSTRTPDFFLQKVQPLPSGSFEGHAALQAEYLRHKRREPMAVLDAARFQLSVPPTAKQNDIAAWRAAVENARAQLEHQNNRLMNLELFVKHGPAQWRLHNNVLETEIKRLEAEKGRLRKQCDAVNRQRKLSQQPLGRQLADFEAQYLALVAKNAKIQAACATLEQEVAALQATAAPAAVAAAAAGPEAAA